MARCIARDVKHTRRKRLRESFLDVLGGMPDSVATRTPWPFEPSSLIPIDLPYPIPPKRILSETALVFRLNFVYT